jgi:hypothetical protein
MVVSPASNTTYSVTGTAGNLCQTKGAVSLQVDDCTGIDKLNNSQLSIFPNPTRGTFYISAIEEVRIIIYSPLGEPIGSAELMAGEKKEFYISSPGLYILQYQSVDHRGSYKLLTID